MFTNEQGWGGYHDSRGAGAGIGDLWESGGAYGGEYQARDSYAGIAHVVNAPNGLWLRKTANVAPDNGILRMPNNAQVVWYEDVGGGWARVEYYGTVGYASTSYLELGPARAGHGPTPIPPQVDVEEREVIDLDLVTPTPEKIIDPPDAAPKKNTALYIVGALAAAAAAYYYF